MSNGKGSKRRPISPYCSATNFNKRWEEIFSKEDKKDDDSIITKTKEDSIKTTE